METVVVNGIEYQRVEKTPSKLNGKVGLYLTMAMIMSGMDLSHDSVSASDNVDIIKEYELIQQKKSNLSFNQRKNIERIFNRNYKKVEE